MKYKDLIEFDPIESVVQLKDANKAAEAKKLASSYIISENMAKRLNEQVIHNLQFKNQVDNKAILVVGNYGSGKSHLMSVISAIAEEASLLDLPNLSGIATPAKDIAGQFNVIRVDIGASEKPLRDLIVDELMKQLDSMGVSYSFPSADTIPNHRTAFEDMMQAFDEKFPGKGLLFVVDELLDYLRRLNEKELVGALGILREIGEISRDLKFRFIAGVQEAIFDSERFSFEADALRRVKDRFEQVSIIREDIKFVVAERLLKKNTEQKAKIRDYLSPFAKYYGNLNENMDEFVNLFPVHPDYIDTFERITAVEKREALKSLSLMMHDILDKDVPSESPDIIAFDFYWEKLKSDTSFRSNDEIRSVMDCSETLESRIKNAFTRPQYKDMAIRIIRALSIHRFTVGGLQSPMGMTAEELRDRVFLFEPGIAEMGSDEPDKDLLTHINFILKEISKTVSGQFISSNPDNNQWYLDIKKTVDYDAKIKARCDTLDDEQLDKAYYRVLRQVMECTDVETHVSGYQIWLHELIWQERLASRSGYLFFGTPNERSTAVPRRDFYIYFIQPHQSPRFKDDKNPEEVFLYFERNDEFDSLLRNYAAAFELAATSSGTTKAAYEEKRNNYFTSLSRWLQEHLMESFSLTYDGHNKPLSEWSKNISIRDLSGVSRDETVNFRDSINRLCEHCFAGYFADNASGYPTFSRFISTDGRHQAAQDALRGIANPTRRTKQAVAVLDALKLLDGEKLSPTESPYSQHITDKLQKKGQGQVLNRDELIEQIHTIEYMDPSNARLEPEWVAVVIAALVYSGDIILSVTGNKFDATKLDSLSNADIQDIINFKHLEAPKDWNAPSLKALFGLLELPEGYVTVLQSGDNEAIKSIQERTIKFIEDILKAQRILDNGLSFWGKQIWTEEDIDPRSQKLKAAKEFLESLQNYKAPGQFKNFNHKPADISAHAEALQIIKELESLHHFISEHQDTAQWFSIAERALPAEHDLVDNIGRIKDQAISTVVSGSGDLKEKFQTIDRDLKKLKKDYIKIYVDLHTKARLNLEDDKRKSGLLNDPRLEALRQLSTIDLMPRSQLTKFQEDLASLSCCTEFTEKDLEKNPICSHCNYNPIADWGAPPAKLRLRDADDRLFSLLSSWETSLLENLSDPTVQNNMELLKTNEKTALKSFIEAKELPETLPAPLLDALRQVLQGLDKVTLHPSALLKALQGEDAAVTLSELEERFRNYIESLTRGKEPNKIRIVIEQDGNHD